MSRPKENSAFDPLALIENSISQGLDPSVVQEIDERELNWCPNVARWVLDHDYLGAETIYPLQLQVMLRLFGDVCPYCSDWEFFSRDWDVLMPVGNALDRLQLLDFGQCPKCHTSRIEHYKEGFWNFPEELDLCWGMRCGPILAWVFSNKGLIRFKQVQVGDELTHGSASERFDSGKLKSLIFTTDMNWVMKGSKMSHIVPVLNSSFDFEHKKMKDCKVGDVLIMYSPNLWPNELYKIKPFVRNKGHKTHSHYPLEMSASLARFLGYLVSNGSYGPKAETVYFSTNDQDVTADFINCCLDAFDDAPRLTRTFICKNGKTYQAFRFGGPALVAWLNHIGLSPATAHSKVIPDCILQSPKEIVCEFLAGLFGGDGGVYAEVMPNGRRKVLLYYTTVSKDLMEQVRLLLLNLGIVTRCAKMKSKGFGIANEYVQDFTEADEERVSYTISTKSSEYVKIFRDNVRLASKEKQDVLNSVTAGGRTKYVTPVGVFTKKNAPAKLRSLIDQGYFFVKIKDIKEGEPEEMMDVHIPGTNIYTADGFVHHNSGKSAVVGMIASYVLHRYLKIPDPAAYFNLLKGSLLVMRFVALTAGQASESIWHQFVRSVENCTWFSQYHDFLKGHEKRLGIELVKVMTQYIAYPHKKLTAYYLGASIDSSRGRTAFFTAFDEIGWWLGNEAAKRANASETYAAYEKASRTVRNNAMSKFKRGYYDVPTAILACVSSTSSKTDFIMRLIRQSKTDKKKVGSHKASWEVNPEFAINPDELKTEKERNPKTFNRDYGSVPPFADDPFFDNEDIIQKIVKLEVPSWPIYRQSSSVGAFLNASDVDRNDSVPYLLAIDLGKSYSGYAAALMQLRESDFSVAQVSGLFAVYPSKSETVDLSSMFQMFIKKLCEKLRIVLVVYDQWQSKTQIDELRNLGIKSESYSLTFANFTHFRTQVGQQKLELPEPEMSMAQAEASSESLEDILYTRPYLHLIWQMLSVSEVGNKVTKGEGHDDLFRAVVLGCRYLWDEKWRGIFEYKSGMAYSRRDVTVGKGRLALAGGSRGSGQFYSTNSPQPGTNVANSPKGRPIGVVVPRSTK